jgi:hypothetical protein
MPDEQDDQQTADDESATQAAEVDRQISQDEVMDKRAD